MLIKQLVFLGIHNFNLLDYDYFSYLLTEFEISFCFLWFRFPQAETFDPETYEWIPLHEPPWKLKTVGKLAFKDDRSDTQFMFVESRGPGAKMKRLITYDVNTRSWDRFEVERTPKLGLTEAAIAFKGIVYWYSKTQNNLLAYDLGKRDWFRSPVSGMEVALPQSNDDDTHVWMLHLGGEKMCLVWHVLRQGRVTVNCTTFRVLQYNQTILHATIESSTCSEVNGSQCLDVIAV